MPDADPHTRDRKRAAADLPPTADVVVIGAGIVGLATARAVLASQPDRRVVVVDKEARVAAHQSGHNSGVIHAGIYYKPGSAKARLCLEGRRELFDWCDEHDVRYDRCGKVVVATDLAELDRLEDLEGRARANGIDVRRLGGSALRDIEPHAAGIAALAVPSTAVVDFAAVCEGLAAEIETEGASIVLDAAVGAIERDGERLLVRTARGDLSAARVANCAGLQSDRVARLSGDVPPAQIVPFRGEYHELVPPRRHLVRALIYPVPDPRFPFLGVHLTRAIDGEVHAGPNAVLAFAREGYRWRDAKPGDLRAMATNPAVWRLARRYWRTGVDEIARSFSVHRLAAALARLVPEIEPEDLRPAGSGVRAQALGDDGTLVDDFLFGSSALDHDGLPRLTHVVNAPSPAATASLAIGRVVADRVLGNARVV
jgi:L-2-hydroxyglutarate oxidase